MYAILRDSAGKVRFTVAVAAYVEPGHSGLALLEMYSGTRHDMKAVWANLVKSRTGGSLCASDVTVYSGGHEARVWIDPSPRKYKSLQKTEKDENGKEIYVFIVQGVKVLRGTWDIIFDGSPEEPSPWFLTALRTRLPWAIADDWEQVLWAKALEKKLVEPVKLSWGVTSWTVNYWADSWRLLLEDLVKADLLTTPTLPEKRQMREVPDWRSILAPPPPPPPPPPVQSDWRTRLLMQRFGGAA